MPTAAPTSLVRLAEDQLGHHEGGEPLQSRSWPLNSVGRQHSVLVKGAVAYSRCPESDDLPTPLGSAETASATRLRVLDPPQDPPIR